MSYYAAGGYYRAGGYYAAGGFFKKLIKAAGKVGNVVSGLANNPIGAAVLGMVPGGATALTAMTAAKGLKGVFGTRPSMHAAVVNSNAGTPGAIAYVHSSGRARRPRRMRRRRW